MLYDSARSLLKACWFIACLLARSAVGWSYLYYCSASSLLPSSPFIGYQVGCPNPRIGFQVGWQNPPTGSLVVWQNLPFPGRVAKSND